MIAPAPPPSITIEDFLTYCRAFNARDYKTQHSFYHPSIELILPEPQIPILKGSEGISSHYQPLHAVFDEILVPIDVLINERRIFFLMEAHFRAKTQIRGGVAGFDFEQGDVARITVWALYDLEDGKMRRIRCLPQKEEFLGGKRKVEEWVEESRGRAAEGMLL